MNEKTYERVIEYLKQQIQEGKLSCGSKQTGQRKFSGEYAAEKSGKCVFHDAAHRTEQLQGSQPNPANPGAGGICTGSAVEKSGSFKEAESRNQRDADTGKDRRA